MDKKEMCWMALEKPNREKERENNPNQKRVESRPRKGGRGKVWERPKVPNAALQSTRPEGKRIEKNAETKGSGGGKLP